MCSVGLVFVFVVFCFFLPPPAAITILVPLVSLKFVGGSPSDCMNLVFVLCGKAVVFNGGISSCTTRAVVRFGVLKSLVMHSLFEMEPCCVF